MLYAPFVAIVRAWCPADWSEIASWEDRMKFKLQTHPSPTRFLTDQSGAFPPGPRSRLKLQDACPFCHGCVE